MAYEDMIIRYNKMEKEVKRLDELTKKMQHEIDMLRKQVRMHCEFGR